MGTGKSKALRDILMKKITKTPKMEKIQKNLRRKVDMGNLNPRVKTGKSVVRARETVQVLNVITQVTWVILVIPLRPLSDQAPLDQPVGPEIEKNSENLHSHHKHRAQTAVAAIPH